MRPEGIALTGLEILQLSIKVMKVNELKALFEKNGAIHTSPPPPQPKPIFIPSRIEPVVPAPTISAPITPPELPPLRESQERLARNNEFLNELNKKLMNKSARSNVIAIPVVHEIPFSGIIEQQTPTPSAFQECNSEIEIITNGEATQAEEELNFDDILGNADKKAVFRSGLKLRLGINERNPSTQEEEQIFSELEIQRKSEAETEAAKQNVQEVLPEQARFTKKDSGAYSTNIAYKKLQKCERIARINRIINNVFGIKSIDFISGIIPSPRAPPIIKPEPQPIVKAKKEEGSPKVQNEHVQIKPPSEVEDQSEKFSRSRTAFAMSKEMLSEMNFKIKRRNETINSEPPAAQQQQSRNERSVSPLTKRKKNFEKFQDS